jgi:hypothetical protein
VGEENNSILWPNARSYSRHIGYYTDSKQLVKHPAYPQWFEDLWKRLLIERKVGGMRSLGGRDAAYRACVKLEADESDVDYLIKQYINQRDAIIQIRISGGWHENIKDISGWLNGGRYQDEIDESAINQTLSKSERNAEITRELLNGSNTNVVGIIQPGSSIGNGRHTKG